MRILILNYLDSSAPGGISKVVSELHSGLTEIGHDVKVIQPVQPRNPDSEYYGFRKGGLLSKIGIHHLHIGDLSQIANEVKSFCPQAINIHGSRTFLSPIAVSRIKTIFPKIPVIFSPHHDSQSGSTFSGKYLFWIHKAILLKRAYKSAEAITVCSDFEREQVEDCTPESKKKIFTIPNGIDIEEVTGREITEREKIILSAGYLFHLKGLDNTIRALRELHDRGHNEWKFVICGDGPHRAGLQRLADDLGVSEYIDWKGFVSREELVSLINKTRVATLVSRSENFGIFAAECLSMGVPTVVTNVTALPEFDWIEWCYCVDFPVNPSDLADKIITASMANTTTISSQKNIQPWSFVSSMMSDLIEQTIRKN